MCGIFGISVGTETNLPPAVFQSAVTNLFRFSETRGKEASGLAVRAAEQIMVHKEPVSTRHLIRSDVYRRFLQNSLGQGNGRLQGPLTLIGHARLTTNGFQGINSNNQPVIKAGLVGIHNGIITNVDDLWRRFSNLRREFDVDTEVVLSLIRAFYEEKNSLEEAVRETYQVIEGTASLAILFEDLDALLLATNTGSLYSCRLDGAGSLFFASENYILRRLAETVLKDLGRPEIKQIEPGQGLIVNLNDLSLEEFSFNGRAGFKVSSLNKRSDRLKIHDPDSDDAEARRNLRRCAKCILPETMPFIEFDEQGVCNYCREYKKVEYKGPEALAAEVEPFRKNNGEPEVIVAFSGGRDSSYCLHYIFNELKLKPLAYTYDWGMVNDLARRNQARVTGRLGVEQILISADIKKKRKNIRRNVEAWLKKPDLGLVPLFMAGDKHFFYFANKLVEQTGVKLCIWAENQMERTNFKTGFCGLKAGNKKQRIYKMGLTDKFRLAAYYGREFITNPAYLNRSLFDTMSAYWSYYMINHDYIWFYDYLPWDERLIEKTLIEEYDWETDPGTSTTWRIGDETAAFYNYIYYTVAGLTENDTLRSNQIREGLITREEALRLVEEENRPRYGSIQEYLGLLGLDFDEAMRVINSIPKLYRK